MTQNTVSLVLWLVSISAGMFFMFPSILVLYFFYRKNIEILDIDHYGYSQPMILMITYMRIGLYSWSAAVPKLAKWLFRSRLPDIYSKKFNFSWGFLIWMKINFWSYWLVGIGLIASYFLAPK